jgi:acyl-coenzyme A thioesterase PaaI-like protein
MANKAHFRALEKMYLGAPVNEYYKPQVHIEEGEAEIRIPIREDFFHAAGAAHGVTYFKTADDSSFFAANSLVDDCFVLTTNLNLYLERPIAVGIIIGRAKVVFKSKTLFNTECILTNNNGDVIGRATATFFTTSRVPLDSNVGYVKQP